jgi:hypothetical protein
MIHLDQILIHLVHLSEYAANWRAGWHVRNASERVVDFCAVQ